MSRVVIALVVLLLVALPSLADAQGRGQPKRPQVSALLDTNGPARATVPVVSSPRQFGVWLDDASGLDGGQAWAGIGVGYWRAPDATLVDVPIVDVAYGVTNRVQLAASVPFYRASYQGTTSRGLDDVYLSAKIIAVDPAASSRGIGFAISPVVEILSAGFTDDRVHWALPLSVELRRSPVRLYGATGYFSRGAVFGAGAVEWASPAGTVLTGALTRSFSTDGDDASAASRGRADVAVTISHPLTSRAGAYASIGRSLVRANEGATLGVSAGLSVVFGPTSSIP